MHRCDKINGVTGNKLPATEWMFMKTRAFILIVLAGILWGTAPLFVEYLAPYGFTSLQMTMSRSVIAVAIMIIYMLFKDIRLFAVKPLDLLLFAASGLSFVGAATLYYQSLQMTSSATAVVLMYTAPVIVMFFSVLFLGERMTKLKCVSVIAMVIGCCLVSGIVGGLKFNLLGIIFGALSGISYSVYNIVAKISMKRGASPISATFYAFLSAMIASAFISNPVGIAENISGNAPRVLPILLLFGIATCILPYFLYTVGMRDIPAGTASSLAIIEPMAATVLSAVFLNQKPDVFTVIGIILILGAVALLGRAERSEEIEKDK